MLPTFKSSEFEFKKRKNIPSHIDKYPNQDEIDHTTIQLEEEDRICHDIYPIAINIDDMSTAALLKIARQKRLEITQPPANGRRDASGPQYRVHIRIPGLNDKGDELID